MDIVERLRHHKSSDVWTERKDRTWYETDDLCMEAAVEIERLQKQAHYHYENGLKKDVEIERLQAALLDCIEVFGVTTDTQYWKAYDEVIAKARTALNGERVMNKIDEEVQRVLKWIECRGYKDVFTVDTVITDLAPINHLSFQQVADVLNQEIRKGNIEIVRSPTFSASKDLKWPLLKRIRKMDKSIERRFQVIEMMLQKISDKVDALPEKKQRLWNPWTNSNEMTATDGTIEVMMANGVIITEIDLGRNINWLDNLDSEKKIVAWR